MKLEIKQPITVHIKDRTYKCLRYIKDPHVCTVHQQYQNTVFIIPADAHNYKITGMLKIIGIFIVFNIPGAIIGILIVFNIPVIL